MTALELLPIPEASTGLCVGCRADAALPDAVFCADCAAEVREWIDRWADEYLLIEVPR